MTILPRADLKKVVNITKEDLVEMIDLAVADLSTLMVDAEALEMSKEVRKVTRSPDKRLTLNVLSYVRRPSK